MRDKGLKKRHAARHAVRAMKTVLSLSLCVFAGCAAFATSAYEALRAVGKERGDALLDKVIEVRGIKGAPEPATWRIVVADAAARGGVREFDVRGGKVVGERTPVDAPTGRALNLNQLNLDSDGAHTVAERESKKTAFAYDHVDYSLRAGTGGGTPVWEVRLVDDREGNVATLSIGAESGKVLDASGLDGSRRARTEDTAAARRTRPPEPVKRNEPRREDREEEEEVDKPGTKVSRFAERAGRNIGGAFQKFGDKLNRAFTGEPKKPTPRPQPAPVPSRTYRDRNGTEFYRPRD